MKDISAYIDTLHSQRNQRGKSCASSWRMKAISLFYSIDTDTMYHHAPGLPPRGNPPRAQGTMGARRMPWHRKSTKGAASRDRPGGGANGPRSRDSRMGEPSRRHGRLPRGRPSLAGTTGGTETSKYPEEEKSTEIARVAASESARAQTGYGAKAGAVAYPALRDAEPGAPRPRPQSENHVRAERHGKAGRSG